MFEPGRLTPELRFSVTILCTTTALGNNGDASYFEGEMSRIWCLFEQRHVISEKEGCDHPKLSRLSD